MNVTIKISWWQVLGVLVTALVVWWAIPAGSQPVAAQPVSSFAFVARADNPVDALAASSVAGQLGAPVYLTGSDSLDDQARQGLTETDPQVVVLAGGTAALSAAVEQQIGELLPGATVRRFAGAGRTETARLVNTLTTELGVDRPVLAGGTVTGDVGIDGNLTLDGADVAGALSALTARVDALEAGGDPGDDSRIVALESALAGANERIGTLETDLAAAEGRIGVLETTFAGVSREGGTLLMSAINLQVVNGEGETGTTNGLGNVIVGYNAQRAPTAAERTGSHYLVVGDEHGWTAVGGILAGFRNTASGPWASVLGGSENTASGPFTSVSGGDNNQASGEYASVSGGFANTASGLNASVSGGGGNKASDLYTSVSGGSGNTASSIVSSVSGGQGNTANGFFASVSGGSRNTASGGHSSVVGGEGGVIVADYYSLIGNELKDDTPTP